MKADTTISWTVQPHKKSINFGVFKHPGHIPGLAPSLPTTVANPPPTPTSEAGDGTEKSTLVKEVPSTVVEKLTSIGMKQVHWAGKYDADKIAQGAYDVGGEAGNYALVFDNTFSKNMSKTATVFLLTYPTKFQTQIQFGAQLHHSQAMASVITNNPSHTSRFSPKLKARGKESNDSLKNVPGHLALAPVAPVPEISTLNEVSAVVSTGVLQKRRRKKGQGYARRFFSLDFSTSTLSYYHDRNSSALRGSIPLSLAAIGANAKTREISIDSGAEIWHLRANNKADFEEWKRSLERASRLTIERSVSVNGPKLQTEFSTPIEGPLPEDEDWVRLETLLSRISGTRDAVRRLCAETIAKPLPPPSPGVESDPTTPTEHAGDDYFKQDEKRPFWKRKPSANTVQTNVSKRSVSAQLAAPITGAEPVIRNRIMGLPVPLRQPGPNGQQSFHSYEPSMNDHCLALFGDLDTVVKDFASLLAKHKQLRLPEPKSTTSRVSMQSMESQEYFDADDGRGSTLLTIQHDSDEEGKTEDDDTLDDDSITSSDMEESDPFPRSRKKTDGRARSLASLLPAQPHSLAPLPLDPVRRRATVLAPTIMPPSLIGFLRKNVGKDLSTISMPVSANEPISLLQRASEQLEYSALLDQAAKATDAVERLIYVTAFAISGLSAMRVKERSLRKPFNPMLGETFELVREDRGFRFISEKVSHRPVQLAFVAEARGWSLTQSPMPSQKFWGKSSEIVTEGKSRLLLHDSGEHLSWSAAPCFLRNILAGEKYVEPVGSMTVVNETTGHKAVVTFRSKGMFAGRSEELDVQTFDSHGAELPLGLYGTWTQSLQLKERGNLTRTAIWKAGPLVEQAAKHYGMTSFAATLNEITPIEENKLPPTDSRLRPDQRALEEGDYEQAERLKNQLEEKQRSRRKEMELKGEVWKPRWFSRVETGGEVVWKLRTGKEGYWEERARGDWTGVIPVLSP